MIIAEYRDIDDQGETIMEWRRPFDPEREEEIIAFHAGAALPTFSVDWQYVDFVREYRVREATREDLK